MATTIEIRSDGPRLGFRLFRGVLALVFSFLALLSIAFLPLAAMTLAGHGTVKVDGALDAPYAVSIGPSSGGDPAGDFRRRLEVIDGGHVGELANFPAGRERGLTGVPAVHLDVLIDGDDTDARVTMLAGFAVGIGLAWIVVLNLRGVAASVAAGEAFDRRNIVRLRWVGATVLAFPICAQLIEYLVDRALDHPLPVSIDLRIPGWWVFAIIGLGVLALAEVFGEGARLREFERETV
jgi:hypothetical protein